MRVTAQIFQSIDFFFASSSLDRGLALTVTTPNHLNARSHDQVAAPVVWRLFDSFGAVVISSCGSVRGAVTTAVFVSIVANLYFHQAIYILALRLFTMFTSIACEFSCHEGVGNGIEVGREVTLPCSSLSPYIPRP